MKPTLYGTALLRLAVHFKVGVEEFRTIPQGMILEWAKDVKAPLTTAQHRFLIGEHPPEARHPRTKLIERLSGESLAAVAAASGQSVRQMAERAGVRV